MIEFIQIFPKFEFSKQLRIELENFGLREEFVLTIKLKDNKEYFFELNNGEVIFNLIVVKMERLQWQLLKLFVNLVIVGFLRGRQIVDEKPQQL